MSTVYLCFFGAGRGQTIHGKVTAKIYSRWIESTITPWNKVIHTRIFMIDSKSYVLYRFQEWMCWWKICPLTVRYLIYRQLEILSGRLIDVGLVKSSFSEVLSELLTTFERVLCSQWILWSSHEEKKEIVKWFYTKLQVLNRRLTCTNHRTIKEPIFVS